MEAPRWRLQSPHYLNVPEYYGQAVEWEHSETSRESGRRVRKLYKVPLHLDTKDPSQFNYPGEIIVAHKGEHNLPLDIIFVGDPTPDMEPLNEAAQKINDSLQSRWQHPIDTLPTNGDYSAQLLAKFTSQLDAIIQKVGIPKGETLPNTPVPEDAIAQLQTQMNLLLERNAELERRIAQMEHADDNEPLPEVVDHPAEPPIARRA